MAWAKIGILALILATAFSLHQVNKERETTQNTPPKQCEAGVVNPDGSVTITETEPGNYEYTAYATSDGIKILRDCNQ